MTLLRYSDSATADNLELLPLYNDDRIGIDPDAKQLASGQEAHHSDIKPQSSK
jgi:hypothetical protein